jgi:hypothetical protein
MNLVFTILFPFVFAVFGVSQKTQRVDDSPVVMDGRNEAKVISAHIEHHHLASTVHGHRVRRGVAGPDFLNVFPLDFFGNRAPVFDPLPGFGVPPGRLRQKRDLDNAHDDKM